MIPAKTWYKTHNDELLAIVEAFKTWRHYLEGCKHKVLALTNYNNLCHFIDIKSLSFRQICWSQELFKYYFRIDYCQDKANGAVDVLFCFPQRKEDKEEKFWTENTWIFHCLQFSLTNATLSGLSTFLSLSPLYPVFICRTNAFLQLRQF